MKKLVDPAEHRHKQKALKTECFFQFLMVRLPTAVVRV